MSGEHGHPGTSVATVPVGESNARVRSVTLTSRRLHRVGARPGYAEYLYRLWTYRGFIAYDARSRALNGNRRDRLGSAWLILNPMLNGLTYYLIFGLFLRTGAGIENFVGYLIIGIFLFQFSARSITNSGRSIQQNRNVVQAFSFPRAALPLAANVRELIAGIPVLTVMLLLVLLLPPTEDVTWKWLLVFPALALQWTFNLGIGLILARIISKTNDVVHLLGFALRAWMYSSAVFYSYERFIEHPVLLQVVQLNPLFNVLDIVRDCLLYNQLPSLQSWAILGSWAAVTLVAGSIFFWRAEETYGRG